MRISRSLLVAALLLSLALVPSAQAQDDPTATDVANKVGDEITKASEKSEQIVNEHMSNVEKDPGSLITREAMAELVKSQSFLPARAGQKSITLEAGQGFDGNTNYQPANWKITESMSGPTVKKQEPPAEKENTFMFPFGMGPLLLNMCTERNYSKTSPCYNSRQFELEQSICLNIMDAAKYLGVGFDGRGYYSSDSRKISLVQRVCSQKANFMGFDIPDNMNIFGIFHTVAETKSFQSVDEYMEYVRDKAGLSNQKGLFSSEASKYGQAKSFGVNLGGIGALVGAGIGAVAGGPAGAMLGATLGGAIGGSIGGGSGSGSGSGSSTQDSESSSSINQEESSNKQQSSEQNFFAIMYVNVILYEMSLDVITPTDLTLSFLKDYMDLPSSYYTIGADVKYQNFLLRWGTHYIRSGKFGGQLKVTKTMKTTKTMTSQEFARIAEDEFKSMFSSLQSEYKQKSSGFSLFGAGSKSKSTDQKASGKVETDQTSEVSAKNTQSQAVGQSEFTQTSVEAQGGSPEIAEALMDFYTPAFKQLFHDWLVSIEDFAKPFEFQLRTIHELLNMRMSDLFPAGNVDFGCVKGGTGDKKIVVEPETNKRYYVETKSRFDGNKTIEEKFKVYCRYHNISDFAVDVRRRNIALERAVSIYMVEGPFPTSSYELPAGEIGCEHATMTKLNLFDDSNDTIPYADLKATQFLLVFDLPLSIAGIAAAKSKFRVTYQNGMWYATTPEATEAHLYDGCELSGYNLTDTKICFRNIVFTYKEASGMFHVDPRDFQYAKLRMPSLPNWLSGSTVARAEKIKSAADISRGVSNNQIDVPCNVKWLNSHRLDPHRTENCLHFSAATEGDIFVVFASIPQNHHTWRYVHINQQGVSFYKGFQLESRLFKVGIGVLGERNLFQSFFMCVIQKNDSLLMQYGKSDPDSDVGTVYASYRFPHHDRYNILSFYSFGSGEKPVSFVDIRLTKQLPTKIVCLHDDHIKVNGHCVLDCHSECNGCKAARDNKACQQCKHLRVEHGTGDLKVTECVSECIAGTQLSTTVEKLCEPCPAGLFKDAQGNNTCSKCPVGTFSSGGATKCSPCTAGTFNDKEGQPKCQDCPAGQFVMTEGATGCNACPIGQFSSAGSSRCELCRYGHYGDSVGMQECKPCAAEYFADKLGQTSCQKCPAGTTSVEGSRSCGNSCQKGEFSPEAGVACQKCPAGSFAESAGSESCSQCQPGSYQPQTGQAACLPAPAGTFVAGSGATAAQNCTAGTFNDKEGQTNSSVCRQCAAGSHSAAGAGNCTECAAGSYQSAAGQPSCTSASLGHFVQLQGQLTQEKCRVGTFAAAEGSTACSPCPKGQFAASEGAVKCSDCPAGQFAATTGLASCSPCPAGEFSPAGAANCTKCPAGSFSSSQSGTCTPCPVGQFGNSTGATSCSSCPAGSFSNAAGAASCTSCPVGHFSSTGAANCSQCPAGSYTNSTGTATCSLCPAGQFSSSTGATSCTNCSKGRYAASPGSTSCTLCSAGSIATTEGTSKCTLCPAGYSDVWRLACAPCSEGYYADSPGTACQPCSSGHFAPEKGSTTCALCPSGISSSDRTACVGPLKMMGCSQSSYFTEESYCDNALDGDKRTEYNNAYCFASGDKGLTWWMAHFDAMVTVETVSVIVRTDKNFYQMDEFVIKVDGSLCVTYTGGGKLVPSSFNCGKAGTILGIEHTKPDVYLTMCEVEATGYRHVGGWRQLKLTGCGQSSDYRADTGCSLAMDGDTNGIFSHGSVTSTQKTATPWWRGTLESRSRVRRVLVYNRIDCCLQTLAGVHVWIGLSKCGDHSTVNSVYFYVGCNIVGQPVTITSDRTDYLTIAEVVVYGNPE